MCASLLFVLKRERGGNEPENEDDLKNRGTHYLTSDSVPNNRG